MIGQIGRSILELLNLTEDGVAGLRELALELTQTDGQRRDLLVQIVMQLASDVFALLLLRDEQPSRKVFDPGAAFAQILLRPPAPGALGQQREDQYRFDDTQRDDANDPPFIKLPERGFSEADDAARRQPIFTDSPAP